MIKFVSGDFFDYDADIRINTVNCVGVMGAGVALIFKKKFPDMFDDYYKACKKNEVQPGHPHVWKDVTLLSECTIINFPTKIHWKNPSQYEYIEKGLIWLRDYLSNITDSTVTLPALGCGHGGLEWEKVKVMITNYLKDLNVTILVFEPSSSTKKPISDSNKFDLKNHNISHISPNDEYYPAKLVGRSATGIYAKGNLELMRQKSISIVSNFNSSVREKKALLKIIDELPTNKFIFTMGLGNSYEIDLAKEILSRGFKVLFIIPQGILQLKIRKDLQPLWHYEKILVLSTASPTDNWKRYESFKAFKLRLNISDLILFNSLDLEFILKYQKDLEKFQNKLFYVNYWTNEIEFFKNISAMKIGVHYTTHKPNILPLLTKLDEIKK